jgi:hypothetical protein
MPELRRNGKRGTATAKRKKNKTPSHIQPGGVTRLVTKQLSATSRPKSTLLEEVPVLNLPASLPYQNQGTLWTRRDSNPHLVTRRVNVLPITPRALHRPYGLIVEYASSLVTTETLMVPIWNSAFAAREYDI